MRHFVISATLFINACTQEAAPPPQPPGLAPGMFAANERDGLCIVGVGDVQRAGFITYGANNANCSAGGTIGREKGGWTLQPTGDSDCRIPLTVTRQGMTLGPVTPACAYYCAPGTSFAGKSFTRIDAASKAPTDLGGDPLC